MLPDRSVFIRFIRFNAVGAVNIGFKLVVLAALREWAGFHYLTATAVSVEASIVHGFLWHELWTFGERRTGLSGIDVAVRLFRYNLITGVLGVVANVALVRAFVGAGMHYLIAAGVATPCAGFVSFLLSEKFIFLPAGASGRAAGVDEVEQLGRSV